MNSKLLLFTVLALTTMPLCAMIQQKKSKSKSKDWAGVFGSKQQKKLKSIVEKQDKNWAEVFGSQQQEKSQSGFKNWAKVIGRRQKEKGRLGGRNNKRSEKKRKKKSKKWSDKRGTNNPFLKAAEGDELEHFHRQWAIYIRISKIDDGQKGHFCCSIYRPNDEDVVVDKLIEYYNGNITKELLYAELRVPVMDWYWKKYRNNETVGCGLFLCDKETNKDHNLLYHVLEVKGGFFS